MKVTVHNGRAGKNGVYSAAHNDQRNGEQEKKSEVLRTATRPMDAGTDFTEKEANFYEKHFRASLDAQNEKHIKARKKDRVKSMDDYRTSPKTCPEESLWYIGDTEASADPQTLWKAFREQMDWEAREFPAVQYLNYAMHQEDGAPHIHARRVWVSHDAEGRETVSQSGALRDMGIEPPDPTKKVDRYNNAKQTYTARCREHWVQVARSYGFEIDDVPREAGKSGQTQAAYKTRKEVEKLDKARADVKAAEREAAEIRRAAATDREAARADRREADAERKDADAYYSRRTREAEAEVERLQQARDGLLRPSEAFRVFVDAVRSATARRGPQKPTEAAETGKVIQDAVAGGPIPKTPQSAAMRNLMRQATETDERAERIQESMDNAKNWL